MEAGSNVIISFSFHDTFADNPIQCQYSGDYPSNIWNSCSGTNHTFLIPGTIKIVVAFTNAINTIYKYLTVTLTTSVNPIIVETSLQLSSSQCSAAYVDNRAIASFIISAKNTTAKPASNAQVIIVPDSINNPTITQGPFQLTFNYFATPAITSSGLNVIYTSTGKIYSIKILFRYIFCFFSIGNYTAIFRVSNSLDSTNISCVVNVTPILQQVYYAINSLNWPLNSLTPFQASVYIGDPNPGTVMLTWNFGDGTNVSSLRTGTEFQHIYFI
jgi:hypothetical protein